MPSQSPPMLARLLLHLLLRGEGREFIRGDIEEEYAERILPLHGEGFARRWYWRQATSSVAAALSPQRRRQRKHSNSAFSRPTAGFALWYDVRYAVRTLRKRPLFTAVAVLTLGLGIGGATAAFGVVDGVLLKPLPYEDPSRLVNVWVVDNQQRESAGAGEYWDRGTISYPQYRAWRRATTLFDDVAVFRSLEVTMTGRGRPSWMTIGIVSSSLFPVLGVQPSLGRWFLPEEEAATPGDGAQVAVLSDEMWRTTYQADPNVLGSSVVIDDRAYTVVGVMPRGFRLRRLGLRSGAGIEADWAQLWVPIGVPGVDLGPGAGHWEALGRLPQDVSIDEALAETRRLSGVDGTRWDVRIVTRTRAETRGVVSGLVLLLGAAGLLMMIACVNTATLLLGENHSRRHEIGTRLALGASGRRVVRQLLTESLVLGVAGSVIGVLMAFGGTRLLTVLAPPLPRLDQVAVDMRVLAVASALGVLSGLLFGTVPALISAKSALGAVSRVSHRSTGACRGTRFERGLVSLEIALTTVILVACGLFVRSLSNLLSVDPGFQSGNLIAVHVSLSQGRYPTDGSRSEFYREALTRIRSVPGVNGASATDNLLFPAARMNMDLVRIPGSTPDAENSPFVARFSVAPDYFSLMGIPVLAGRALTQADDAPEAQPVMLVNETMASRYWPGESPLGAKLQHWLGEATVVGVVRDVKFQRWDASPSPTIFVPLTPTGSRTFDFIVSVERNPSLVTPRIREAIWSVDGDVAIDRANTMASLLHHSGSHERLRTRILLVFGVAATLLAVAGVFGVTARAVALNARELGIRMALGAREVGLMGATVRSGLLTGATGTVVGLTGAYFVSRLVSRFLFGVGASDAVTYGVVAALLMLVCLVASYLPARGITRVDPVEVLRAE
jgi:putative ABC transport system permease protein